MERKLVHSSSLNKWRKRRAFTQQFHFARGKKQRRSIFHRWKTHRLSNHISTRQNFTFLLRTWKHCWFPQMRFPIDCLKAFPVLCSNDWSAAENSWKDWCRQRIDRCSVMRLSSSNCQKNHLGLELKEKSMRSSFVFTRRSMRKALCLSNETTIENRPSTSKHRLTVTYLF